MLGVEDFEKAGYRRFDGHTSGRSDYGMQKKFSDLRGIQYYLTVQVYDWRKYPLHIGSDFGFEITAQFRVSESVVTNLVFVVQNSTTIIEIEDFYQCYWGFIGNSYYEGVG